MKGLCSALALLVCAAALVAWSMDWSNVWALNTAIWSLLAFLNGVTR